MSKNHFVHFASAEEEAPEIQPLLQNDEDESPLLLQQPQTKFSPCRILSLIVLVVGLVALVALVCFTLPSEIQARANSSVLKFKSINISHVDNEGILVDIVALQDPPPISIQLKPSIFTIVAERNKTTERSSHSSSYFIASPENPNPFTISKLFGQGLPDWNAFPDNHNESVTVANVPIEAFLQANNPEIHFQTIAKEIDFAWASGIIKEFIKSRNETQGMLLRIQSYSWIDIGIGTYLIPMWSFAPVSFDAGQSQVNVTGSKYDVFERPIRFAVNATTQMNVPLYFKMPFQIQLKVGYIDTDILTIILDSLTIHNGKVDFAIRGFSEADGMGLTRLFGCFSELARVGSVTVRVHQVEAFGDGARIKDIDWFLGTFDEMVTIEYNLPEMRFFAGIVKELILGVGRL